MHRVNNTLKIYLDNCCYNRPYDDQSQIRISLEAQAKIYIQTMIETGNFKLVSSYMLIYENSRNRIETKRKAIEQFIKDNTAIYIDDSYSEEVEHVAIEIQQTGVKSADAIHVACAILAKCDFFITTDDRLLKYKSDLISIVDPVEFIRKIGSDIYEQYS